MVARVIHKRLANTSCSSHIVLLSLLAFTVSFASALAWKVSDVDFATKLGSEYLVKSYLLTALVLFVGSSFIVRALGKILPQTIFFNFQKYSLVFFGSVTVAEAFFHISQYSFIVFAFKVLGYAYSSLIVQAFWVGLNVYDKRSPITTGQCTFLSFSTYVGMATAGVLLQSSCVGASQFGLIGAGCCSACWLLGKLSYETSSSTHLEDHPPAQTTSQNLLRAVLNSRSVLLLVIGSILLNVLVSSTEYSVIADFESRFMSSSAGSSGNQTIGSFVTFIGLGNSVALFSSHICLRHNLGHKAVPLATVLAFLVVRCGFSEGLITAALSLVVMESLYPLVVESNLSYLLQYFPEHQRISARILMETLTEPAGLFLSAALLSMSWVGMCTLGIGVIIVSLLLTLFSYTIEGKWMAYFSLFRGKRLMFATRVSAFLVFCQAIIPWVEHAEEVAESLWIHEIEWFEPPL